MKKFLCALLAFVPFLSDAQTIGGGELPPIEPIKKTVFDSATVKVYYEYAYRRNPDNMEKWKKGQAILLIGSRYTGCADYFQTRLDSLNDAYYAEKRSSMDLFGQGMSLLRNANYKYPLVIDNEKNVARVQIDDFARLEYKQRLQPLAWTLVGGDSIVAGVHCKKAVCRMGGRDWVAWYSEEYNMPFGPYLFRGLPGLIFAVTDTKNNYVFTLNGLEMLAKPEAIYLNANDKILKLSRKDAFKAHRNAVADPLGAMNMSGASVTVPEGTEVPTQPFNPIELE